MKLLLLLIIPLTTCEIFTSTDEMTQLLANKKQLIDHLSTFLTDLITQTTKIQSQLHSIESEFKLMSKNPQNYVENPLNAFILIKTLSHDIQAIKFDFREVFKKFNRVSKEIQLPKSELTGVIEGLVRLQEVFHLKSKDLANGEIDKKKTREKLKIDELLCLGTEYRGVNKDELAEGFFRAALNVSEGKIKQKIYQNLFEIAKIEDNFKKAEKALMGLKEFEDETVEFYKKIEEADKLSLKPKIKKIDLSGSNQTPEKVKFLFSQSCRGRRHQNSTITSKLFCRFHSTNYFTKIAPFKQEIMNFQPFLAVFHDVISDREIEIFKTLKKSQMDRAGITGTVPSPHRIAKFKNLNDEDHEVVAKVSQRVGDMTGLKMKSGYTFKTHNYGIGGHFALHMDFTMGNLKFQNGLGNRIATCMFYLSSVEKGGATVFPFLKVYVPARKGTAVFWYNLSSSGEIEPLTYHGACPVLLGSKWVANKWIYEHGQEFTRPCKLKPALTEKDFNHKLFVV